ncbi:hypothetical protein B9T35_17590 [Acinetobacter sp. ANC 3832]|nr:AHH domain-containing protein [Acinetobacter sp. ANC 3832]OTG87822.1 hypothetical protein B9T35_17590 [Acinetobacter sp. ANC 3832]
MQVHNIIPKEVADEAKEICPGFDVESSENLIALPDKKIQGRIPQSKWYGTTKHQGSHGGYTASVSIALRASKYVRVGSPCAKINRNWSDQTYHS